MKKCSRKIPKAFQVKNSVIKMLDLKLDAISKLPSAVYFQPPPKLL